MIRKDIDVHLDALAGYINDEDKLVTYKWLSKELGIHVNLSKQILFEYWETQRKRKDAISATFLLIGYSENGGMRVEVVKEANLLSAKKKLSQIISEHVYSLQKTLPEIELLAITDKGDSQQSAVRCTESVIRSEHEMEVLRWGSTLSVKNVQSSASKVAKQANVDVKPADQTNNVKESITKTTATKAAEKTQKNAFNNLFAKAIDKQNKEKDKAPASVNNTKSKTTAAKNVATNSSSRNAWFEAARKPKSEKEQPENSDDSIEPKVDENTSKSQKVSTLMNSENSKSKASVASDTSTISPPKNTWFAVKNKPKSGGEAPESSDGSIESKVDDKQKEKSPESKKTAKKESPEISVTSGKTGGRKNAVSSRGKKRQSSAKSERNSKRRKRIVVAESSDESSGSEMEDIKEPDSPEEIQVFKKIRTCPSPPLVKCEGGRRKVRKLVDKTFMDDDGYFVTQKEYVYESCSDKEEEVQMEIDKPAPSELTTKTTHKRKQATLFNFFKKS